MFQKYLALFVLFFFYNFSNTLCSDGDRSPFYQKCVISCVAAECAEDGISFTPATAVRQDPWAKRLQWSCRDECRYGCMWKTVDAFKERMFTIPKFHGKWPFQRFYGIQEPASTLCSILNLAANGYMLYVIRTSRRLKGNQPMKTVWQLFAMVSINAWAWSTIFHTRDTPFTEFMDYACALSMITAFLATAIIRNLYYQYKKLCLVLLVVILAYFVTHTQYLYSGIIDYDYNMLVNIVCGMLASLIWLLTCLRQWWRREGPYVWRMIVFNKLSGAALLLELMDFPPILECWDAHALWHLATAPLPLLLCRFVIDDIVYLQSKTRPRKDKTSYKLT